MNEANGVLVINAIVDKNHVAELPTYLEHVTKIFDANGGKPIGRYKALASLAGEDSPEMVGIMKFPSVDIIRKMVNGSEFQSLGELRSRVFSKLNLVICEGM